MHSKFLCSIYGSLALALLASGQITQSFYMNIYANEDCKTYKSTQQLGDGFDGDANQCINIDWAESYAVDVYEAQASAICVIKTYENEDCTGLITSHQFGNANSGCFDSPVSLLFMTVLLEPLSTII